MKNFFLSLFLIFSCYLSAQDNTSKNIDSETLINAKRNQFNEKQMVKAKVEVSLYFNLDNDIKKLFSNNTIPSEFPNSVKFNDRTAFIQEANKWISENKNIIISSQQNTILN